MRGTILAAGMILAADGNRYSYRPEDIQPANGEGSPAVLSRGDEVEFMANGQAAQEICLAKTRLIDMNASAGKENLVFIRILGMAGAALILLCEALNLSKTIPSIGYSCHIAGFVCISLAIILLSNKIASPTLKKNDIFFNNLPCGTCDYWRRFSLDIAICGFEYNLHWQGYHCRHPCSNLFAFQGIPGLQRAFKNIRQQILPLLFHLRCRNHSGKRHRYWKIILIYSADPATHRLVQIAKYQGGLNLPRFMTREMRAK